MAVVTITPQDGVQIFTAGTMRGSVWFYCLGPDKADVVYQVGNDEPVELNLLAGFAESVPVNGAQLIVRDYGPSNIQLLWSETVQLRDVSRPGEPEIAAKFDQARTG
jgi:hypothetical protein